MVEPTSASLLLPALRLKLELSQRMMSSVHSTDNLDIPYWMMDSSSEKDIASIKLNPLPPVKPKSPISQPLHAMKRPRRAWYRNDDLIKEPCAHNPTGFTGTRLLEKAIRGIDPRPAKKKRVLEPLDSRKRKRYVHASTGIDAGIYRIVSLATGHAYHGSSWNVESASEDVMAALRGRTFEHIAMQSIYDEQGPSAFRFEIVDRIDGDAIMSVDEIECALEEMLAFNRTWYVGVAVKRALRVWRRKQIIPKWTIWAEGMRLQIRDEEKACATEIQRVVRGRLTRFRLLRERRNLSCQKVQAICVGYSVRKRLLRKRKRVVYDDAAYSFQAAWRLYSARKYLRLARERRMKDDAAEVIQRAWKAHKAYRVCRAILDGRRSNIMAGRIQRFFKAYHLKMVAHNRILTRCVIRVQAAWRRHRGENAYFLKKKKKCAVEQDRRDREMAAAKLQLEWRQARERKRREKAYREKLELAAIRVKPAGVPTTGSLRTISGGRRYTRLKRNRIRQVQLLPAFSETI